RRRDRPCRAQTSCRSARPSGGRAALLQPRAGRPWAAAPSAAKSRPCCRLAARATAGADRPPLPVRPSCPSCPGTAPGACPSAAPPRPPGGRTFLLALRLPPRRRGRPRPRDPRPPRSLPSRPLLGQVLLQIPGQEHLLQVVKAFPDLKVQVVS